MNDQFAPLATILPLAEVHPDVKAFLSQGENHQVVFMEFEAEVSVPEHSHAPQLEFVVDGELELTTPDGTQIYRRGDWFFLGAGVEHAGLVRKGYKAVVVFFQADRYKIR